MALHLIRHLQPHGAAGMCYGRQDLSCGAETAAAAAAAIRTRLSARVLRASPVFTSPLSRCRVLAQELAAPGMPCIAADLMELDFGAWEGIRWDDLPRDQLDAWARDVWHYRPGGGESAAMVEQRWRRWYEREGAGLDSAIVLTHAGVIRAALAWSGRLSREEAATVSIGFGSVHLIGPPARESQLRGARPCAIP